MRKITPSSTAILGTMLALLLYAAPAQAQLPQTWVASNGTSNATCGRTTPCQTFQQAHDATSAGGEINCVDAADYGQVVIDKSISIICDNTQAGILVPSSSFGVTIQAGANGIVTLKGLDIEGGGTGALGIHFNQAAALHLHKVQIRNFRNPSNFTGGLLFRPNGYAELYVADSYITGNGAAGADSGGIVIAPFGSGSANVSINRVRLENNFRGIFVDGTASTGVAVNAVVLDSVVAGSAGNGIAAFTQAGKAAVSILVDHSVVTGNFASGIDADGATASGAGSAVVRIGDSTIALNATGVSATNSGVLQSFKNNRISGNLTDGTPIPAFPGPGGTPLQ